ncbi:hypothetical protein CEXT_117761 [Caerostris extrusa]|uniref:Uncharacterized protein n=1 Tax=Caerostris extrusa TaxID=172846 RepID=A0AAV4R1A0_CAEEX|nr:hypothetical protein CEXT_117761 [Caerostris extrusa]
MHPISFVKGDTPFLGTRRATFDVQSLKKSLICMRFAKPCKGGTYKGSFIKTLGNKSKISRYGGLSPRKLSIQKECHSHDGCYGLLPSY